MERYLKEEEPIRNNRAAEKKERQNLYLFAAGKLVSQLGTYSYSFAVSLYILKLTGSGATFAFSIMLGVLPRVLFGPIAGSLADRIDRKKMIVLMDFLSGGVLLILTLLSMLYGLRLPFLYTTTFLLAVISTFFNTSFAAAIPSLVSDRNLVKINSYSRAIDSGSQILGPVLAGFFFGFVSMELFLLMNGISFVLSAISELFIDFNLNRAEPVEVGSGQFAIKTFWTDLGEVLSFLRQSPILSIIMPFSIMINFLISASLTVVLPFLLNNTLGFSSQQYGAVEGAFSVGMLIAALIVGKVPEQPKKRTGMLFGIIGMGVSLISMGIPGLEILSDLPNQLLFPSYILLALLFALLMLLVDLPMAIVTQRLIPDQIRGRVMGIWSSISGSLSPIGIILAGITLDLIPSYIIFFASGLYFITSAIILNRSKALRDL